VSTLFVNKIQEETPNNGVQIPGHVVQVKNVSTNAPVTLSTGGGYTNLLTININMVDPTNHLHVQVLSPNLRKTSGAGASAWWDSRILLNGTAQDIRSGALGYPETFADHRYILSMHGMITSGITSGTNTIILQGSAQSSGSSWIFSYQNFRSEMTVMEIAQ